MTFKVLTDLTGKEKKLDKRYKKQFIQRFECFRRIGPEETCFWWLETVLLRSANK